MTRTQYVGISSLAAFGELFGARGEHISHGYVNQLTGRVVGSSHDVEKNPVPFDPGMRIQFDILLADGVYIYQEIVRQSALAFWLNYSPFFRCWSGSLVFQIVDNICEHVEQRRKLRPLVLMPGKDAKDRIDIEDGFEIPPSLTPVMYLDDEAGSGRIECRIG